MIKQIVSILLDTNHSLSYKDLIEISYYYEEDLEQIWKVEYEAYFNPYAEPPQLFDIEFFPTKEDAIDFIVNYLKSKDLTIFEDDNAIFQAGKAEGHADIAVELRKIVDRDDKNHWNIDGTLKEVKRLVSLKENLSKLIKEQKLLVKDNNEYLYLLNQIENLL